MLAERRFDDGPPGLGAAAHLDPSGSRRRVAARSRRARSRCWSRSRGIFGLRLGVERAQRQSGDPRRGLGAVQLRRATRACRRGPSSASLIETMDKLPARARAVGRRRRDRQLRHDAVARVAAVLHQGPHRLDGGPVLRVVGHHVVPLHDGERAREVSRRTRCAASCTARSTEPRRLRARREAPADARRQLPDAVLAADRRRWPPTSPTCTLVATVPDLDGAAAEGLEDLPGRSTRRRVAAGHRARRSSRSSRSVHAGNYQQCWGQPWTDTTTPMPKLGPWECAAAPWFMNAAAARQGVGRVRTEVVEAHRHQAARGHDGDADRRRRRSRTSTKTSTRSRSTSRRSASRCSCARRTSRTGRCTARRARTASRRT